MNQENGLTIEMLKQYVLLARERYPNAIIAGGAVRDLVCGALVKDIDLFIGFDGNPEKVECQRDEEGKIVSHNSEFARFVSHFALHVNCSVEFAPSDPEYGNLLDLARLTPFPADFRPSGVIAYSTVQPSLVPFDIVAIPDDPINDVPNYDFGLSQMFVTDTGQFMTDVAARDWATGQITFTPVKYADAASILRSRKRLERLRAKYSAAYRFRQCDLLNLVPQHLTIEEFQNSTLFEYGRDHGWAKEDL